MPLNCTKRRKTTIPPQNNKNAKKKCKKQTNFPSVKTVSQHLSKCFKENEELNILKQIKIATMRSKSQMAELPDEEQIKVKNKKQNNVKDKKQHNVKDKKQHNVKGKKQHKVKDEQQLKVKDEQQYKVKDKKLHKVKDEHQYEVEDKEQQKVIDQSQQKIEDIEQRKFKDEKHYKVKAEQQYKAKDKKQHEVIREQQHKVIHEHRHKVKDEQQRKVKDKKQQKVIGEQQHTIKNKKHHKVIDEPQLKVKDKQQRKVKDEKQHKVIDKPQHKVKYEQQHNIKDEQQGNIKNKEQHRLKDKKQHKVKEQQHKVEKRTSFEIRNVQITSLSAIADEPTAGTLKKKKKKKISRSKTKYRILAKKFITEYKYFCRLGELGSRRNRISYHTTLWWMRRAGICDNQRVTFRDVEVHFINNLKRGYKLKILGFIRFLRSLCEDRRLRMSTVLNEMLSCRDNNLITGTAGRKPVKRSRLIYTTKSRLKAGSKQTESNVSKTGKKLEQEFVFSSDSEVSDEKNPHRRERVKSASNALLYAKDYPTDLDLLKKWINPSVETDPVHNKGDMLEHMGSSDKIYSNKKFDFEAELLRCTKRQKSIPKDIPRKPYTSMVPCGIQGKLFKFTDKANEFIPEEENYEYVESDSSCDKPCQPSEKICQFAEKIEAKKKASTLKCDNSKTIIATKEDPKLNPKENGDTLQFGNSTDNVFQAHKCISVELINLLNDELKHNSTFQNDQDVLEIFQNSEAHSVSENALIHTNKKENFSNDKCSKEKNDFNGDLLPEIREKTDTSKSKNHETNSPSIERISVDQKTERLHSQKIEKSISPSDGKRSSTVKNRKLSPEVKINPTKNNLLQNCKKKPPQPPKILKNSNLLESQKEHKSISAPKNNTLSNKNLKNTQEAKLSSLCNKNNTSTIHGKFSITKNSINSKKVDDNASQDRDKNQHNENKKKMPNNKVPWNSGVTKFKSTQSKNNVSPNYYKIATTDDSRNGKIASQKNDQRLSQKHKLPPSKNLRDVRSSEISSYRTKNNPTFPNQDAKSLNNTKKTDKANSLSKNEVKIQRCSTRKTVELSNKSKSPKNLEKVGKSNCPAKKEEKMKHCKTHKQDALINGSNIIKEVINSHRDTKSKGISIKRRPSLHARESFTNACKTGSISPQNTNTTEEESFSTVSSKNTENSKMLEEESSLVILSKNKEAAKHSSVIPPESTKNVKVQEENSLSISPKDTEDAKMPEEKALLTILSKSPEKAEKIEVEHNPVILPRNTKKAKMLEEENSPIIIPKDTVNLKLPEEESFLITPSENTGNGKMRKGKSLTIVSSKYTEEVYYEEERSPVISPENTRIRNKEIFPIISSKVIETASISKEESSPFTPSERKRNENAFADDSPSDIPTKYTEEVYYEEELSPVIPPENTRIRKKEIFPIISPKVIETANISKEESSPFTPSEHKRNENAFENESPSDIPTKYTEEVYYEEERSPVIAPENTRIRKKEIFPIISPKVIETANISKGNSSPFTPSEHKRNENAFEDESPSDIPTENTEGLKDTEGYRRRIQKEVERIKEECFSVITSENATNAKMLTDENSLISSKYTENANMLEEKCFEIIPKRIRDKKIFEEESPPVILSEIVKCFLMLEEENLSLKEDRTEYPTTEIKKKADKRRTFTNLPVRHVQKYSEGEIFEVKNLKMDKNKTPKEVMPKTHAFSDKRSTSSVNRCKISKNIGIACAKKVQQRPSANMSKSTYGTNQDKIAESVAKTCKIQIDASLKTKT